MEMGPRPLRSGHWSASALKGHQEAHSGDVENPVAARVKNYWGYSDRNRKPSGGKQEVPPAPRINRMWQIAAGKPEMRFVESQP